MNEEDKLELIEAFHNGRLSEKDKIIFDELLLNDPEFSSDLKIYSIIFQGFNRLEYENISQQIKEWERKYTPSSAVQHKLPIERYDTQKLPPPKIHLLKFIGYAAALLGIIILAFFIYNQQKTDLFTQFFEAPELYLNVRGKDSSIIEKNRTEALNFYVEKNYDEAVLRLSQYVKDNPEDWEALFYLAVSKMKIKQFESAISDLNKIVLQKGNAYEESAEWMLLLSYYKTKNKSQLDLYLDKIIENKSHFYNDNASKFRESSKK